MVPIRRICCWLIVFLLPYISKAQVNLAYGKTESSIPLFDFESNDGLPLHLALNYTAGGGIRVAELASSTGLGWTLLAGGKISRVQADKPDDLKTNGYLYTTVNPAEAIPGDKAVSYLLGCGDQPIGSPLIPGYHSDREMDVFEFSFNGRSGSFRINKNGVPLVTMDSKLKISFVQTDIPGVDTRISKFTITAEDGIMYVFDKLDIENEYVYKYTGNACGFPVMNPSGWGDAQDPYYYGMLSGKKFVQNWHLTQVMNPFSGAVINFEYTTDNQAYILTKAVYKTENFNNNNTFRGSDIRRQGSKFSGSVNRLTRIVLPGNKTVELVYDAAERADLPTTRALTGIRLLNNVTVVKQYQFAYKYFYISGLRNYNESFTASEKESLRLCLKTVSERNSDNSSVMMPYEFSYVAESGTSPGMPGRFSMSVDHWGYYNNKTFSIQSVFNFADRGPGTDVSGAVQRGILEKVRYPTGALLTYEFEPNKVLLENGTTVVTGAGARVKKTTRFDGINHANDIVKEYKYVLENGLSSGWGYEEPVYEQKMDYYMVRPNTGGFWMENVQPVTPYLGIYGVIISAIIDIFTPNIVIDTYKGKSYNMFPINSSNVLPVMYSRVEEIEGAATDNIGKTVYEFTNIGDAPPRFANGAEITDSRQRFYDWNYGLPKKISIYNKQGALVKTNLYEYRMINVINYGSENVSSSHKVRRALITPISYASTYWSQIQLDQTVYYPLTGRAELAKSTERLYDVQGNFSETQNIYEYNATYLNLEKVTVQNSVGETTEKRIYYPYNFAGHTDYPGWTTQNFINTPVLTENWTTPAGGTTAKLVSGEAVKLEQVGNGMIKPASVYSFYNTAPITATELGTRPNNDPVPNYNYYRQTVLFNYTTGGNISQQTASNKTESYIYSNDGLNMIAAVSNGNAADIAYGSFESGNIGNWNINRRGITSDPYMSASDAPTGTIVLDMDEVQSISKSGLTASKAYRLTCWIKNTSLIISGGTQSDYKELLTIGSWKLVSMKITGATSLSISTGFTGYLDELKLMPEDALMRTVCFDTKMNKVAETDEANNIVYYEYDPSGRLTVVRDMRRNIVKTFCYDVAGLPMSCQGVFGNETASQEFTRNNCPPGAYTQPVLYIVESGTHFSRVSQADANAKAQADIAANGQNYANQEGLCLSTVYVRMSSENEVWDATSGYGDIVVRFYADEAATQPLVVTNLQVNYRMNVDDPENGSYFQDFTSPCSGTVETLLYAAMLYQEYEDPNYIVNVSFELLPGAGYEIIY